MTKEHKLNEGQIQLNVREHYGPLESLIEEEPEKTSSKFDKKLYQANFIDEMTKRWLCQTPSPPRISIFYTDKNPQTYIHQ